MIRTSLASLLLVGTACGSSMGEIDPTFVGCDAVGENGPVWQVAETLRLGDVDGASPEGFGNIRAFSISDVGDIAVLDAQAFEIRVFDVNGGHRASFGRRGNGPGELEFPTAVHFTAEGRIWVVDAINSRYSLFDLEGDLLSSRPRPTGAGVLIGDPGGAGPDGFYDPTVSVTAETFSARSMIYVNHEGVVVDTLPAVVDSHRTAVEVYPGRLRPFMARTVSTVGRDGSTWIASTDEFRIIRRNTDGDTTLVIQLDRRTRPLTSQQRDTVDAIVAQFQAQPQLPIEVAPPFDPSTMEVSQQVIRSLHPDENGGVLVQLDMSDVNRQGMEFDRFDENGQYVGRLCSHVRFASQPPVLVHQEQVYGITMDELGVQYIVRGRLVPPR